MKNQFFYTRKELVSGTPENPVFKEFRDSFNVNTVIRSITIEDGRVLVLLNDIHERPQEVPMYNKKKELTGYKRERGVFQSELYLTPEDGIRFMKLTAIVEE